MSVTSHITRRPRVFLERLKNLHGRPKQMNGVRISIQDLDKAVRKVNEMVKNLDQNFFKCQQKYLDC